MAGPHFLGQTLNHAVPDPHCVRVHPAARDVAYQQDPCGIHRLVRAESRWERTGANLPAAVGRPAVYGTRDAGRTWKRPDRGLPKSQAWFTVKRQAMGADTLDPVGLSFGTTGGAVWGSFDEQRAIRPHIRFFVDRELARSLEAPLAPGAEVLVVAALSGG